MRPLRRSARSLLVLLGLAGWPAAAAARDFAPPPDERGALESSYRVETHPAETQQTRYIESEHGWPSDEGVSSNVRFHVGPALLLRPTSPGLFTALSVGEGAVGARFSAAWMRAESAQGLSSYGAELWLDFRSRYALHPIVGAGASFLRGEALGGPSNAGAGTLRGALEYELPLVGADARVGVDLLLLFPAIGTERTEPWALGALMVGAGF